MYLQRSVGSKADGALGPKTKQAMRTRSGFKGINEKVVVFYIQWLYNKQNRTPRLTQDGVFGPLTDKAMDKMSGSKAQDKQPKVGVYSRRPNVKIMLPIKPPKPGTSNITRFFGKPGTSGLVRMTFPGKMRYAGKIVRTTRVHKKAKASFEYYMEKDLEHYGQDELDRLGLTNFSGCYNFRSMRGGKAFSTHSWAIASDTDAGNNRMRFGRDQAKFARVSYQAHWNHVYEAGFKGLGFTGAKVGGLPTKQSYDWMHIQLTQ